MLCLEFWVYIVVGKVLMIDQIEQKVCGYFNGLRYGKFFLGLFVLCLGFCRFLVFVIINDLICMFLEN